MLEKSVQQKIQGLIGEGKLEEAIRALCEHYETVDQALFQSGLSLLRRLRTTEEEFRRGTVSREDAEVARTRIADAALMLTAGKAPAEEEKEETGSFLKRPSFWIPALMIAVLVLLGGYFSGFFSADSRTDASFDLKIYVRGNADTGLELDQSSIKIRVGDTYFGPKALSTDGEAFFPELPVSLLEDTVALLPENRRWEVVGQSAYTAAQSDSRTITFEVAPVPDTVRWRGTVLDPAGIPVANAQINVEQGLAGGTTNAAGEFDIYVPGSPGRSVQVTVTVDGRRRRRGYFTLSEKIPTELSLNPE